MTWRKQTELANRSPADLIGSLRATVRAAIAPAHRATLRRGLRRATKALRAVEDDGVRAFAATVSRLPLRLLAMLKGELHPTGLLDYPRARIPMGVASPMEYYRLRSCAKEPETVAWIEANIRAGDVLFDIGANVGAYSLVADAAGAGQVQVVALEPSFATFAQLNRNVFLNHASARITSLCLAVSSETGLATFRYSDLDSGSAFHSLRHGLDGGDDSSQTVLTIRLDDLVEQLGLAAPTLMKIDVDGAEAAVLAGGKRVLARPELRSILIELDDSLGETPIMIHALNELGFVVFTKHRRQRSPYHNYIFVRDATPRP